jgi:hypothetical protein
MLNTRENAPLDWAMTHIGLARVLIPLAAKNHETSMLSDAVQSCRLARDIFDEANNLPYVEYAEETLERATFLKEQLGKV